MNWIHNRSGFDVPWNYWKLFITHIVVRFLIQGMDTLWFYWLGEYILNILRDFSVCSDQSQIFCHRDQTVPIFFEFLYNFFAVFSGPVPSRFLKSIGIEISWKPVCTDFFSSNFPWLHLSIFLIIYIISSPAAFSLPWFSISAYWLSSRFLLAINHHHSMKWIFYRTSGRKWETSHP